MHKFDNYEEVKGLALLLINVNNDVDFGSMSDEEIESQVKLYNETKHKSPIQFDSKFFRDALKEARKIQGGHKMTKEKYLEILEELKYNIEDEIRITNDSEEMDEEDCKKSLAYVLEISNIDVSEYDIEFIK